jgi:hypothetical protein
MVGSGSDCLVRPHSQTMKSIEFLNTHATYKKEQRLHNRSYLCLSCGVLRRAPANYVPDGPPPPQHCSSPMVCLSHEQTVAATHLPAARRVDWMRSGGYVRDVGGKRKWRVCDHVV